jgi:hypothetical protein
MEMRISRLLVGLAAFIAVHVAAGAASADYVCGASYRPSTTAGMGSEGYLTFSIYTGKDCTGTPVSNYWFCSTGATSANCTSSASYRYERQGLLASYRALVDAIANNVKVFVASGACNGGSGACANYVHFWAD